MAGTPHAPLASECHLVRVQLNHPHTGQTLRLHVADTERLLEIARDWIPRYGSKVKTVVLTWWTDSDLRNLPPKSGTPEIQQALNAAETFIDLENSSAPLLERVLLLHDALIATILPACSNLLDLKILRHTRRVTKLEGDHHVRFHSERTLNALDDIGGWIGTIARRKYRVTHGGGHPAGPVAQHNSPQYPRRRRVFRHCHVECFLGGSLDCKGLSAWSLTLPASPPGCNCGSILSGT